MNSDSRPGRSAPSGQPETERNDWGCVRLCDPVFSRGGGVERTDDGGNAEMYRVQAIL